MNTVPNKKGELHTDMLISKPSRREKRNGTKPRQDNVAIT
jgi:hypothetical protein